MRVLVTGANGFVGRVLCDVLARSGCMVRAALRGDRPVSQNVTERTLVGDIGPETEWQRALDGVDSVIHLAARVHVLKNSGAKSDAYDIINAGGTRRLAEAAVAARIRQFIYLSSVKVNGGETTRAYTALDEPHPQDAYGWSKWWGEQSLQEIARGSAMQAVIVRPPLVYGPGVKANFLRLMHWIDKERLLPLGSVENSRSMVAIWNLCDFLVHVLKRPESTAGTWMVSDGEDLSTPDLIRRIADAMGRRAKLLPVPVDLLRTCGILVRRTAEIERLCGSLTIDITQTSQQLGWSPPVAVTEALVRTVDWYFSGRSALGN